MHIVERGRDFAGEQGGARERGVAVVFDQTQEAVAFDEFDLAHLNGGDRDQGAAAGDDGALQTGVGRIRCERVVTRRIVEVGDVRSPARRREGAEGYSF